MLVVPSWIEAHCVIPDGFRRGQPFRLYDAQALYVTNFYLVKGDAPWIPGNPVLAPAFVYSRGLLVAPQKWGKNPLIATQVCVEGVGPALFAGFAGVDEGYACSDHGCRCGWEYPYDEGEPRGMPWPTPLIQITAFSEDSTENTYDALRPMIDLGPLAELIPKTGEEFIRLPGGGRIDTVTSSNQSRLGQRTTFVPQDELGLWTAANKMTKLADTQYRNLSGMGGRASLTSNAWDPSQHSIAQREYESKATDVYRQFIQPPKNLSFADKRERRKILRIVYPLDHRRDGGGHADVDSIDSEAVKILEHDQPQAERFYGNILTAGAGAAVDPDRWDELGKHPREVTAGTYVGLGFDGSISRDATALRGCTADGYRFTIKIWQRPVGDEMRAWQLAHPGDDWRIPRTDVAEVLDRAFEQYVVGRMYMDPHKWFSELEAWQQKYGNDSEGKPIVRPLDTMQRTVFGKVVDRWLTGIAEGLPHDGDPVAGAHVKAAHKEKVKERSDEADGRTLYVLVKGDDHRLIDAAIADTLALEAATTMPPQPPPQRSVYEDRGVVRV